MSRRKKLSNRQLAVMDELFAGRLDEQSILDKHKVARNTYNKWLADKCFLEEFERRIASAYRQSELIIARYSAVAAAKLVQLTDSEKEETARRACLDIISLPMLSVGKGRQPNPDTSGPITGEGQHPQLSAETAARLLAALAEENDETQDSRRKTQDEL